MKTYLVSVYYRGAMNVDQMRSFTDIVEAFKYWDFLGPNQSAKRFYEVSDTGPPRQIKDKDRPNVC